MLKTHLQPVLAYFFNVRSDRQVADLRRDSHLQSAIDYWNQKDSQPASAQPTKVLHQLWHWLTVPQTEPQIRQRFYHNQPYWRVYDPVTGQRHTFTSEAAVYRWLEHRYSE